MNTGISNKIGGKYELIHPPLGEGGFGRTYLTRDWGILLILYHTKYVMMIEIQFNRFIKFFYTNIQLVKEQDYEY